MNKTQLIEALSAHFDGNRRAAAHALESVVDTVMREVARGEKVAITGFGAFEKAIRPARMVRNPRTGERTRAKKTAVPKFRAGSELKAVVSGAKKLPKRAAGAAGRGSSTSSGSSSSGTATKSTATKSTAKKTPAKKSSSTAKKSAPAKKSSSTAKKSAPAKKSSSTAKKSAPAKKSSSTAKKSAPAKKSSSTAKKSTAKKTATRS